MKKGQKFLKDNRGAALVSIMIAVAFIAILASALLYMSYSNFKMKVVNYESKVNFYETEGDLTTITTSIRNEIANSSTPLDTLKTTVGCYEIAPNTKTYRYNPKALAKLIDDSITITDDEGEKDGEVTYANGDKTVVQDGSSGANFVIYSKAGDATNNILADDKLADNEQKIVLKDVVVEHTESENGYVNKLQTDIVFRVTSSPSAASPGGIGEFSVLTDSPVQAQTGAASTRITLYGNSFVGPGNYTSDAGVVYDPSDLTAIDLGGNAYFTQKGDYMIVYGDINLSGQAVLNISQGSLTVYGDINLSDSAAFLCSGNLYMMDGCSIKKTSSNASVIPSDLTPTKVTSESLTSVKTTLGLMDSDPDNDGIVNQIIKSDMKDELKAPGNWVNNNSDTLKFEHQGLQYNIYFWKDADVNNTKADASLCFLSVKDKYTFGDGANRNTTFISMNPVVFTNSKNTLLTQIGSSTFNYIIDKTHTDVPKLKMNDGNATDPSYHIAEFFVADATTGKVIANDVVNNLISNSVNGGGGEPIIDTAVGYENWTKE